MHTFYIDTEFTELSSTRQLISLALVASATSEFYVELTDTWIEADCSEFVKEFVLPQLDFASHGKPLLQARASLRNFLIAQGEIEIVGDALDWDWPLLIELLGQAGLPENIVGCRQVDDPLSTLSSENIPHHALLDARLLCQLCEPQPAGISLKRPSLLLAAKFAFRNPTNQS